RELGRDAPAVLTRVAGADDRDRDLVGVPERAAHRERERCIRDLAETHRIAGIAPRNERRARTRDRARLGLAPGEASVAIDGLERRARRAETLDECQRVARPETGRDREREPRARLRICRHGKTKRLLYLRRRCKPASHACTIRTRRQGQAAGAGAFVARNFLSALNAIVPPKLVEYRSFPTATSTFTGRGSAASACTSCAPLPS